jgi:flagellar hook-basal body complex protein FliE
MITPVQGIPLPVAPELSAPRGAADAGSSFQSVLKNAINSVEQTRNDASQAVNSFLRGEDVELHSTVLAAQKAELSFEMFLQMRNKVVQAYQEIMRSQI